MKFSFSVIVAAATVAGSSAEHRNLRQHHQAPPVALKDSRPRHLQRSAKTIVSDVPKIDFEVYNSNNDHRKLSSFDTNFPHLSFSVDSDGLSGEICSIGCEGDYSSIKDELDRMWHEEGMEYELFFSVHGRYAVAAGVIYDNFPRRVQELKDNHPNVDTIILVECPGSANDNAMIPGVILANELGYSTCVPSDGHTASGGTDFFTGGVKRYATPGARVGIHSWAYTDDDGNEFAGSDLPRDHPEHRPYLDFADAICIPQDFYWETLSHGLPMHYITDQEFETTFSYLRSDCDGSCEDGTNNNNNNNNGGTDDEGSICFDLWYDSDGEVIDHWYDIEGDDCQWYADEEDRCSEHGDDWENFGHTANQACCVCGGGQQCVDKKVDDQEDWVDIEGDGCQWYAEEEDRCSEHGDSWENNGLTANEACCACGGGN